MDACDLNLLSAFVDGELEVRVRDRVAAHIAECPRCQAQVQELRELSSAFTSFRSEGLKPIERARLHQEIEAGIDAPIWRLGGAVGLIAASILVIASTWLATLPAARSTPGNPTNSIIAAVPSDWEQIARTGFVPIGQVDEQIYLADSGLDEFMINALNGSRP
jgi:anti-sigma factor RsiW